MSFFFKPKRWLVPYDYINLFWGVNMQIAVEFEHPKFVAPAVEEFIRCMNSFRSKANLFFIYSNDIKTNVHKIPSGLNTLKDCAIWMNKDHQPTWNPLATIACDDTRIVISSSHSCNDGMRCIQLIEHISSPSNYGKMISPPVSTSIFFKHKKEIYSHELTARFCTQDEHICRLFPKNPVDDRKHAKFLLPSFECPISELMGYDKQTGRLKSFTETQWIVQGLCRIVFENDYSMNNFGLSTVVDLRRILPPDEAKNDPACQECISNVPVTATPNMDMSLAHLGELLRANFNMRIKRKDYFSEMATIWPGIFTPWAVPSPPGVALETSSMGPVNIKSPVKDAWISLITPDKNILGQTSFLTCSIVNKDKNENRFVGQFQANSQELNAEDTNFFAKMLEFGMKNLSYNMDVKEALEALSEFKSKYS